jgi:hypothetical protein
MRARPKESDIVGNLLIQHTVSRWCSSGCVDEGCSGVDRWLQIKDQALQDFLYRQPSRQASTTCPLPCAETVELLDAVFSTAGSFHELKYCNDMLDLDFRLTFWIISKWPYQGHEAASEDTMLKRGGGVCGSLWPWSEGEGRISCVDKEEEGAPGYVRGRGKIQGKCGDGSLLPY